MKKKPKIIKAWAALWDGKIMATGEPKTLAIYKTRKSCAAEGWAEIHRVEIKVLEE
jgi:hypothetical protein